MNHKRQTTKSVVPLDMTVALLYRYTRTKHPEEYYTVYTLTVYLAFNIMVHCCILFS